MWKSTIALGISIVVLSVGLVLTGVACPNGAPCPSNQEVFSAGLIDIVGLILVPLTFVVWARQRVMTSRRKRKAEEATALALVQRRETLSKMRIILKVCPNCGAPLDLASASDSDLVRCGYCGNLVVYRQ